MVSRPADKNAPAAVLYALLMTASPAFAQPGALQDSTLDNLVHAKDYVTSAPGALGAIVERGKGPRSGPRRVTLPGFEGTPAPPMAAVVRMEQFGKPPEAESN